MKIAFLVPSRTDLGPIIFTRNLINGLQQKGCHCELFYFRNSQTILDFGIKQTKLGFASIKSFSQFDIVHTTGAICDSYVALHRLSIKAIVVCGIHNFFKTDINQLYSGLRAKVYLFLWQWALRRINNFIFSSKQMQDYYVKEIKLLGNSSVIAYGIAEPKIEPIDQLTADLLVDIGSKYKILLGCGMLIKRKGFDQLVSLLSTRSDIAVVLIGSGEKEAELLSQASTLGVEDRLVLLGFRSNSVNYYRYCDAYVMCSNSEGFGLAMLEAMALGTPIICSDLPIYSHYFSDKDVALFELNNIESLSEASSKVFENRGYYSKSSLTLFHNNFSLDTMAKNHINFYETLLGNQK